MNVGTFYAHEQGNDRDYVTAGFDLGWGQGADIGTDDTLTTVAERLHCSAPDLRFLSRCAPRFSRCGKRPTCRCRFAEYRTDVNDRTAAVFAHCGCRVLHPKPYPGEIGHR